MGDSFNLINSRVFDARRQELEMLNVAFKNGGIIGLGVLPDDDDDAFEVIDLKDKVTLPYVVDLSQYPDYQGRVVTPSQLLFAPERTSYVSDILNGSLLALGSDAGCEAEFIPALITACCREHGLTLLQALSLLTGFAGKALPKRPKGIALLNSPNLSVIDITTEKVPAGPAVDCYQGKSLIGWPVLTMRDGQIAFREQL